MATQNFHDQLPDYFAGDLSPAERQAFEKAMKENAALREAAVIWQDLDEVLAPAPEDQLLKNIARLRSAAAKKPRMKVWPWIIGVSALLLVGALSWFFWPEGETTVPVDETSLSESTDSLKTPVDTLKIISEDSLRTESVAPPTTPDPPFRREVTPPPPVEEEEGEAEPPVFAANYDPNPLIEAEMTEQLRGGEISLELTAPASAATVLATNGTIPLAFAGEVTTDLAQGELTIRLLLLSNAMEDYLQSNYIASLPALLTPSDNGYTLTIEGAVAVSPGLYYYFLEWEEEETYLKIGKLRVE